ncbi:hypothetical protein [Pseudobacteroides cellulosolvens]|uniref:Uncharacterized protein n=1 Tax=Pseudobacteroides cellulosolvens ATCC 35603 = DSM 2933 TaxID=398512 RepID=A0A0L6JJR1_9FIRM|nr:hypothetical protein [Pseudobacteroides cellulosolvens]KNY25999.1 hypothetical protein Bccel_1261 [Pseudobacteroides cellulosolvens ATCC 35603 = DSM 2933]
MIVYDGNPAIHLYKRFGFEVVQAIETKTLGKIMGSDYHTHLLMEKIIQVKSDTNSDIISQTQNESRKMFCNK